ncbi:hypothetical protein CR513_00989, partial [Mucuna pruriens]
MFRKVEINIPLLDAIKQDLCVHKRKKMKGSVEVGSIVSALTRNEDFTVGAQSLPKKCQDPGIFLVPCTISECTFANAMMDLGASINKSLNFGDLEPIGMTIQLSNRSVVHPLGILEDVLVQVNELIFLADFYVLDMDDETFEKDSTLILGRPFLMIARTKIDVHVGMLSMEFGDTLVQFNIFEAMKDPTEEHSLFGIDLIDELVEEYFQLDNHGEDIDNFAESTDSIGCLGSISKEKANYAESGEVHNLSDSVDNINDIADLDFEVEMLEFDFNPARTNLIKRSHQQHPKPKIMSSHLVSSSTQVGQSDKKASHDNSSSLPPPMELKPLPKHLKYAYLDSEQQLPFIIAKKLHQEQEDKLLKVLRHHKNAIGWTLSDLHGINPSTYMHRILMEEVAKPIRKQQRRMNPTILDVVKKEVTKLLTVGIIYPISESQ